MQFLDSRRIRAHMSLPCLRLVRGDAVPAKKGSPRSASRKKRQFILSNLRRSVRTHLRVPLPLSPAPPDRDPIFHYPHSRERGLRASERPELLVVSRDRVRESHSGNFDTKCWNRNSACVMLPNKLF